MADMHGMKNGRQEKKRKRSTANHFRTMQDAMVGIRAQYSISDLEEDEDEIPIESSSGSRCFKEILLERIAMPNPRMKEARRMIIALEDHFDEVMNALHDRASSMEENKRMRSIFNRLRNIDDAVVGIWAEYRILELEGPRMMMMFVALLLVLK
ncbi:unnamed protein product [Chrysoparadoxa australica]